MGDNTLSEVDELARFCSLTKFIDMWHRYYGDKFLSFRTDEEVRQFLRLT